MKVIVNPFGAESWFGGDMEPVLDMIALADQKGIDGINLPEHVVMGEDISAYPYTKGFFTSETDFYEPMVFLGAIAARTRRVKLTTGILLAALRPAVLLAKQIATLDILSKGRVELAIGAGWQKAEFDFSDIPWEGRFGRLLETVEACRLLWSQCPASYQGKHIHFDKAYSKPFPYQGSGVPILFGIAPSERNIERMARLADGWTPLNMSLAEVESVMTKIKMAMPKYGRDPDTFRLRLTADVVIDDNNYEIDRVLDGLPRLKKAGCTEVNFIAMTSCKDPDNYETYLQKILSARDAL